MNFFDATLTDGSLRAATFTLPAPGNVRDGRVRVGIRPENVLEPSAPARGKTATVHGIVEIVEPIGHEAVVPTRVGGDTLVSSFDVHNTPRRGDAVDLVIELDELHLFDAATEQRI